MNGPDMHGNERAVANHVTMVKVQLEPRIREFAKAIQRELPGATVTTHLLATASFPWWAVVSVCRGEGAREEVAVLDVAYWRNLNRCQLSCDVSTGTGPIIAELPERTFDRSDLRADELDRWITAVVRFLASTVPTVVRYARERGL